MKTRIKIIDQDEKMNIDLFEEVVNAFLVSVNMVVHIRISNIKDYRLRATIIYKPRPNEKDGNTL